MRRITKKKKNHQKRYEFPICPIVFKCGYYTNADKACDRLKLLLRVQLSFKCPSCCFTDLSTDIISNTEVIQ